MPGRCWSGSGARFARPTPSTRLRSTQSSSTPTPVTAPRAGPGSWPRNVVPTQCRVTYNCSGGVCTRDEVNSDGSGTSNPVQLVTGLESNSVFAYSPSSATPDFVSVTIVMPGRSPGLPAITLSDGFEMRNITPIS